MYAPLQLALNGVWKADLGQAVEVRNSTPGHGSIFFWFGYTFERRRFTLKIDPNDPRAGRFTLIPDSPYRIRLAKGGRSLRLAPFGRVPGTTNIVRTWRKTSGLTKPCCKNRPGPCEGWHGSGQSRAC